MKKALLACGLLSSILYAVTDVLGVLSSTGYVYLDQAISELSAVGAPTATLLTPFYVAYAVLFTLFGLGVWIASANDRRLKVAAACLVVIGLLGTFVWPFFPMHARGDARDISDTVHLALGGVDVLLLALAMAGAGSGPALGKLFRVYSWYTLLAMVGFGLLTSFYVPRVDADLPTPYLGLFERLCIGAYLLWIAVFSTLLACSQGKGANPVPRGRS